MARSLHILRKVARAALILVAVLLVVVLGLVVAAKTAKGRRALVRIALPLVNGAMAGHLSLSSFEGDLTRTIIVHDLKLDDSEGVQAIYARRVEVHFDLAALWRNRVQLDDVDVDGAQLLIRHMKDNRVNFAALGGPAKSGKPSAPSNNPLHVVVSHVRLRFDGGYDPPLGHESHPLERPRGSFDIEGGLDIRGGDVTVRVDHLISDARDPLKAHVVLSGGLKVDPPAGPSGHTEITFSNVKLAVTADGGEISRIDPGIKTIGSWKVSVNGAGPMSGQGLWAHVLVEAPKGTLTVDGTLARTWPGVKWGAKAVARGFDPAADWRGLEGGHLDFAVAAKGAGSSGDLEVARFDAASGRVRVRASGESDFAGVGSAKLAASSGDLALALTGRSDGALLHSHIDLRRGDHQSARIDLRAAPRHDPQRGNGFAVVVEQLTATANDGRFTLPAPAQLFLFGSTAAPSLDGELAGIALKLRGKSTASGFVADLSADAPDLSKLASLASLSSLSSLGPHVAGRAQLTAHVAKNGQLRLDASLHGSDLRLAAAQIKTLELQLHTIDLTGTTHVAVDRLSAPGLVGENLILDGKSDGERLSLTLSGHGPAHSTLALALDGRFLRHDLSRGLARASLAVELTVRELSVAGSAQSWTLQRPALIRLDVGGAAGSSLTVNRMVLASDEQTLSLEGRFRPSSGAIELKLAAHDLEPARFAKLMGIKEALSDTTIDGSAVVSGTLHAPLFQASIKASSDKKVEWYGLSFNTLSLEASAARERIQLQLNVWGTGSGRLELAAHGAPVWNGDRLESVDATLDRLKLSANDHVWQIGAPCRLRFDSAVSTDSCKLVAGKEEIVVKGRVPLSAGPMDATLTTHALDLRKLGAFLAPGHKEPPTTSFTARVHASGTRQAPLFDLELRGIGSQIDEGLPENVDYRVRAHYGVGRVDGEVSMRQVGLKMGIGGRFDLPISFAQSDDQPIRLELEARPVPFFKIRDRLPTAIAALHGFFNLRVRASGTTRHPIFSAELHAPSWDLDDLTNNDTVINVNYDGTLLRLNSVTSFAATSFAASLFRVHPKRNSGTIKLEVKTPVDLGHLLARPREVLSTLQHTAQLSASAEIKGVELQRVPLQIIGIATPFTVGLIDGAMSLAGSLDAPSVHASLRASGLAKPGLVDQVDLVAALALQDKLLQVSGKLELRKQPLISFKAEAALDAKQLFDGEPWRGGALTGDFELPSFQLANLRGMQPRLLRVAGKLWGKGALRGTLAAPELLADLSAAQLELGGDRFDSVRLEARYQNRRYRVSARAEQAHGGKLAGEASWSRGAAADDAPFALSLTAQHIDIGFVASESEEVRALSGRLDAQLTIAGTLAAPRPAGFLTVGDIQLALRGKSAEYRNGSVDVRMANGRAGLTLDVATGDGSLHATGEARVDGVQPTRIELTARAKKFALLYGSFAAALDADFGLIGDRASGQWTGRVDLHSGTINLPDLSGADQFQPLGELADVRFGDQRAEKIAQPKPGKGHWVTTRIVGPLELRGREVSLDLTSDLAVTIVPGKTSVVGVVEGSNGTVELFGKPYRLQTAEVRFTGPANDPALLVRATRRSGRATLIVTVSGTALDPQVSLTVDPPIYDQTQLAELMLAGSTRRTSEVLSFHELNRQIGGILSNAILKKIKDQMAAQLPIETFQPADDKTASRFELSPIEVGRYLSDHVYISYEHQFGASIGRSASNANESQIKVGLPHSGELDTSVGDAGVAGVYLYWTYRY